MNFLDDRQGYASADLPISPGPNGPDVLADARARGRDRLTVLLATFDGAAYLREQIDSIAAQDWADIDVIASDDGSTDGTREQLNAAAAGWQRGAFRIVSGPGRGFAENFRSMLLRGDIDSDYVAFCDQDDVWLPHKTRDAVAALRSVGDGPAVFCSRTITTDAAGRPLGRSPLYRRPPAFANALAQNIGGGNTMVLNRAAFRLLAEAARRTGFFYHDWFTYLLVSGAGGRVIYSPEPGLLYRQHGTNAVGNDVGLGARVRRLRAGLGGRFAEWNDRHIAALEKCRDLLTLESQRVLDIFAQTRHGNILVRLRGLMRAGLHRQTGVGQMSLYLAGALGRL